MAEEIVLTDLNASGGKEAGKDKHPTDYELLNWAFFIKKSPGSGPVKIFHNWSPELLGCVGSLALIAGEKEPALLFISSPEINMPCSHRGNSGVD